MLAGGLARYPVDLLAYCLMTNHWHLVLRPRDEATAVAGLLGWAGVTHVRRHHAHYGTRGVGHLYQGRFKSFPVQEDRHFLLVCRYVEANPLRAGLVARAEAWPYSSVRWSAGLPTAGRPPVPLAPRPVDHPADWLGCVNDELPTPAELAALGLTYTLRGPGRPRRVIAGGNQ